MKTISYKIHSTIIFSGKKQQQKDIQNLSPVSQCDTFHSNSGYHEPRFCSPIETCIKNPLPSIQWLSNSRLQSEKQKATIPVFG